MALSDVGVSCWRKSETQGDGERVFRSILGALGMNGGIPIIPTHTWGDLPTTHDGDDGKGHDGTGKMAQWLGMCTTLHRGSKSSSQDPESSQPVVTPALRDPVPSFGL